jgi:ABC-type methionine transport system ATPase subunit
MNIQFNNVGKVKEAKINVDGICVISGSNCTGKTTLARCIYTTLDSYAEIKDKVTNLVVKQIVNLCIKWFSNSIKCNNRMHLEAIEREFINSMSITIQGYHVDSNNFIGEKTLLGMVDWANQMYEYSYEVVSCQSNANLLDKMNKILNQNHQYGVNAIINEAIKENGNISSILNDDDSIITLDDGNSMSIKRGRIVENNIAEEFFAEIGSPVYYNFCSASNVFNEECREKLIELPRIYNRDTMIETFEKDESAKDRLLKMIESSINGHFVSQNGVLKFMDSNKAKPILVEHMGSSLFIFAMIARLLENNSLKRNSTLILDAPVANLQLEWYAYLAQILFMMKKELNIKTVVVTTNIRLIRSIENEKMESTDVSVSVYFLKEENHCSILKNVSNDVEELYEELE